MASEVFLVKLLPTTGKIILVVFIFANDRATHTSREFRSRFEAAREA